MERWREGGVDWTVTEAERRRDGLTDEPNISLSRSTDVKQRRSDEMYLDGDKNMIESYFRMYSTRNLYYNLYTSIYGPP